MGFFSEEGTKYFNIEGKSTAIWQKGNPDRFYARWGSIYDLPDENVNFDDIEINNHNWSIVMINISKEFLNAIKGNQDKKLGLEYSFSYKGINFPSLLLEYGIYTNSSDDLIIDKTLQYVSTDFMAENFHSESYLSANKISKEKIAIAFRTADISSFLIKNGYMKIWFEKSS
jgi:hypothetical protein